MFQDLEHPMSLLEIAAEVIPAVAAKHPTMARSAVGIAVKELLPDKFAEISDARRADTTQRTNERQFKLDPKAYREQRADAARVKNAQVPKAEKGRSVVEGRGRTRMKPGEPEEIVRLAALPELQYHSRNPRHNGRPNSEAIRQRINEAFHGGVDVRSRFSIHGVLKEPKAT
jgi:hypothetical protein